MLLQELFATPYFRISAGHAALRARRAGGGPPGRSRASAALAGELGVVLPVSFFERAGQAFFNSVAVIDADGAVLGVYRKSHIPDSAATRRSTTSRRATRASASGTRAYARIGVGICWDQWFPEAARCMALHGRRGAAVSHGHRERPAGAGRRLARYVAARAARPRDRQRDAGGGVQPDRRRVGARRRAEHPLLRLVVHRRRERRLLAEASRDHEEVVTATVDLDAVRYRREDWSFFRDRRPELYGPLLTLDGEAAPAESG